MPGAALLTPAAGPGAGRARPTERYSDRPPRPWTATARRFAWQQHHEPADSKQTAQPGYHRALVVTDVMGHNRAGLSASTSSATPVSDAKRSWRVPADAGQLSGGTRRPDALGLQRPHRGPAATSVPYGAMTACSTSQPRGGRSRPQARYTGSTSRTASGSNSRAAISERCLSRSAQGWPPGHTRSCHGHDGRSGRSRCRLGTGPAQMT